VTCDRSWFSPDTPVSPTNKSIRHDRTKILLKVAVNLLTLTQNHLIQGKADQRTSPATFQLQIISLYIHGSDKVSEFFTINTGQDEICSIP
jgi:hypothetical protein